MSHPKGKLIAIGGAEHKGADLDKGEIQRAYYELELAGLIKKDTRKDFLGQAKTTYRVA